MFHLFALEAYNLYRSEYMGQKTHSLNQGELMAP